MEKTHEEVENDDADDDDDDMETPQEGGDAPSSSSSRKTTTPTKKTSLIVQTTSIAQRRPKRHVQAPLRLGYEDHDLSSVRKKVKCPVEITKKLERWRFLRSLILRR